MLDPPSNADASSGTPNAAVPGNSPTASNPEGRLSTNPWLVFALPLAVFMLVGALEPAADESIELAGFSIDAADYPWIYLTKIVLTLVAIAWVLPGYRQFAWRLSWLAPAVGLLGGVVWILLCKLGLESRAFETLGLGWLADTGERAAFNPLAHWSDRPILAYGFLAVRLLGLVAVVPLVEEMFLRGLVMRYFLAHEWWKVPFGIVTPAAYLAGTLVPILMHPPSELLAVVVWFSLITWLMARTRNIWDCVAAHAVTNGLLGAWVLASGDWFLW